MSDDGVLRLSDYELVKEGKIKPPAGPEVELVEEETEKALQPTRTREKAVLPQGFTDED